MLKAIRLEGLPHNDTFKFDGNFRGYTPTTLSGNVTEDTVTMFMSHVKVDEMAFNDTEGNNFKLNKFDLDVILVADIYSMRITQVKNIFFHEGKFKMTASPAYLAKGGKQVKPFYLKHNGKNTEDETNTVDAVAAFLETFAQTNNLAIGNATVINCWPNSQKAKMILADRKRG